MKRAARPLIRVLLGVVIGYCLVQLWRCARPAAAPEAPLKFSPEYSPGLPGGACK